MKKEAVISRTVVTRPHQEGAWPRPHKEIHSLVFAEITVEPGKHCIGINRLIEVCQQILEHQPLLPGPVGGDPEPAVTKVIVNKEDITLLERDLVSVGHLCVGEDGHHPLLVIDGLRRRHGEHQPLMLQEVADVGVVTNEVLETVKLPASDVVIPAHGRHTEVIDTGLAEV